MILKHSKVELPFIFPWFKVFPLLKLNFNYTGSVISVLNFFHLRFFTVQCSNPLLPEETLHGDFAVNTASARFIMHANSLMLSFCLLFSILVLGCAPVFIWLLAHNLIYAVSYLLYKPSIWRLLNKIAIFATNLLN